MELANVVPWGRSFEEYQAMFRLSQGDLNKRILGCGDGPASFNVEATGRGCQVTSCDPVYEFQAEEIRRRIDDVYPDIMAKMQQGADSYTWDSLGSVEKLGEVRMKAMSEAAPSACANSPQAYASYDVLVHQLAVLLAAYSRPAFRRPLRTDWPLPFASG